LVESCRASYHPRYLPRRNRTAANRWLISDCWCAVQCFFHCCFIIVVTTQSVSFKIYTGNLLWWFLDLSILCVIAMVSRMTSTRPK
jgi:hypothetical protein